MSETENITPETTSPAKPKRTRATHVAFSSVHVRFAKSRNIDTTRAAKQMRSYIRSNFDDVCAVWPELAKSQKVNRDSAPYPKTIPARAADMLVARNVPKRKGKGTK